MTSNPKPRALIASISGEIRKETAAKKNGTSTDRFASNTKSPKRNPKLLRWMKFKQSTPAPIANSCSRLKKATLNPPTATALGTRLFQETTQLPATFKVHRKGVRHPTPTKDPLSHFYHHTVFGQKLFSRGTYSPSIPTPSPTSLSHCGATLPPVLVGAEPLHGTAFASLPPAATALSRRQHSRAAHPWSPGSPRNSMCPPTQLLREVLARTLSENKGPVFHDTINYQPDIYKKCGVKCGL